MGLQSLVETAGYAIGAFLHLTLLRLVARRPDRRRGEGLFAALAASLLVWNGANLLGAFAEALVRREEPSIARAVGAVAFPALALVPSLLLHTLALFIRRDQPASLAHALFYVPLPVLAAAWALAPATAPALFGAWLVAGSLGGALLAFRLSGKSARRPEALPSTPRFYRFLGATLLATAALAAALAFALDRRSGPAALPFDLLVVAASILPSGALAYGIYRYYAIQPFVRRGAVNLALALAALAIYLLGISTASRSLGTRYGWNVRVIEGLGIVALVLVFHPFRRRVLDALASVIDPGGTKENAMLRGLATDLTRPGASRPAELAARVALGIREALGLEKAGLAILPLPGQGAAASPSSWIDYGALLDGLADAPARPIAPAELSSRALARALEDARVERVVPLRYEGDLVGVLVLGRRADSTQLAASELAALSGIAGPLAAACTSVRLVEQKLDLERRLQEEQRLASLGRFSATIAHRVKNPLASIKAIAQNLREDLAPDDPRRQDLGIVVDEVDSLAKVVSQLLGFARGAPAGTPGPVDARAVAEDVLCLLQHEAASRGVEARLVSPVALPPVSAEPSALREVLANLVENAIQASPRGGRVTLELDTPNGAGVRVRVADEGPGVAPEVRQRLFEPFFTTRPGGTGLGLAVSRQRIEAWGGRIYLEDAGPPGARFAFELPSARTSDS